MLAEMIEETEFEILERKIAACLHMQTRNEIDSYGNGIISCLSCGGVKHVSNGGE
jgi:hypothetical protein